MSQELFKVIREILLERTGKGLTQGEVDRINASLGIKVAPQVNQAGLRLGPKGKALIHSFESFQAKAYKDPGSKDGLPITIGWGSTSDLEGRPIKLGEVWSPEKADAKFAQDIAGREAKLNVILAGKPTTQNQFDALLSLGYNIGMDALAKSTVMRRHLEGNYTGAQAAFAMWNKNDGKVMAGLTRRRADEAALYGRP